MLALQPVDTAVTAFRPDPITQDEAAAMFRAVLNLFGKWELTDEHAATLLDMPVRSYRRWKAEGPGRVSRDSCAFRGSWAVISRDLGHAFHGIAGSHFAPSGRLANGCY